MKNKFNDNVREREMIMLVRNEKRHREAIIYLLNLLKKQNLDIPDDSLTKYLEERFFNTELEEEKEMMVYMKNQRVHRDVISFLINLLESNNINIPDADLAKYLSKINDYDCMWEDYRKEPAKNGKR